jgi:hypothetical protein
MKKALLMAFLCRMVNLLVHGKIDEAIEEIKLLQELLKNE